MISSKVNINITDDFTAKVTLLGVWKMEINLVQNIVICLNAIYTTSLMHIRLKPEWDMGEVM